MCQCKEDMQYELDQAQSNAKKMAEALRDLYNDCGNIAEVDKAFNAVYDIVKEYA